MMVHTEQEMLGIGARLADVARPGDVIALSGGLGAGKTTLARGLLSALGLQEEAPSPSFALVQPYDPPDVRFPVAHVDLYRLDDPGEIAALALDDLIEDSLLLIEWPERRGGNMWAHALYLTLEIMPDGARTLTADVPAAWKDRWPYP